MSKTIKIILENGEEITYQDIYCVIGDDEHNYVNFYRLKEEVVQPIASFKRSDIRSWYEIPAGE